MILLTVVLVFSFLLGIWVTPKLIKGLRSNRMVVLDYYKKKQTYIPSKGGMVLLFVCAFGITAIPVMIYISRQSMTIIGINLLDTGYLAYINYFVMLSLLAYGIFGMMDDYFDIGRWIKAVLPIIFMAPVILFLDPVNLHVPFYGEIYLKSEILPGMTFLGYITYRVVFRFVVIPLYIMVCANLVNMHSGFNGMATGTSIIILVTLILRTFYDVVFNSGSSGEIISIGCFTGGLIALWVFNKYPSKIFEGNTGSMMIGAAIGITVVLQGYLVLGFICLIPHTFNFLLWMYWRLRKMMHPENPKYETVKWGSMRKDGTLKVPNALTLKWIPPYYKRLKEKQVIWIMYGLTAGFCVLGFVIDVIMVHFEI